MLYPDFLKRSVVKKSGELTKPAMTLKGKLILPVNSVYHTTEEGFKVFGMEDDIVTAYVGDKTVENVFGYYPDVKNGKLLVRTFSHDSVLMEFAKNNKQFDKFSTARTRLPKTPKLLHIVNYGNMNYQIEQLDEPLMEYHSFKNYWDSFFSYLKDKVALDKRYHFFKLETPIIVPPRSTLERVEEKAIFSVTEVGYFIDSIQLIVLELWRFLSMEKEEVHSLSMLSKIPDEDLERIHVIFDVGTHYSVINLGLIKHWIKTPTNKKGVWTAEDIQKRLLKLLMNFADFRTNTRPAESDEIEAEDQMAEFNLDDLDETADLSFEAEQAEKKLKVAEFELTEVKKPKGGFYQKPAQKDSVSSQPSLIASIRDVIEQDNALEFIADESLGSDEPLPTIDEDDLSSLDQLEDIQEQALKDRGVGEYTAYTPTENLLEDAVKARAREIAGKGVLTSAELRRFEKLADSYKSIKAPDGTAMEDYLKIDPKDKLIENKLRISKPLTSVLDETYLESSLKKMDKIYIEKFLDKQIHQMTISAFQREGIIVKDIKRTHVKTLMDDYYQYSVKLIPVDGEESTVTFKAPRVTSDGTMLARNVKMRMRKQRADLPIRKVSPREVAMTSYFCKLFVTRSDRMTNNYDKWLVKMIYEGTLTEPANITDLVYGDAFDHDYRAPRTYTSIARTYTSFNLGDLGQYKMNFDHKSFKPEELALHTVPKDEVVCGRFGKKLITLDEFGMLSILDGKVLKELGNLERMIGIADDAKRPIGMIDVGPISGKEVPLGFLLAYYLGLGNLLKTLGVPHRRVNKGQRMNLTGNEFAIRFADSTLIIDSKNVIHAQLLNGFNRYKNELTNFSIWDFDKTEGFEKVFDLQDIRMRQIKRLKQIRTNWVDPITEDLLREAGFPTDMVLLFIEAAKLLEYDDHPDQNDINYSRVRGYERVTGMVYGEIMNALSDYNSNVSRSRKVTMNPESVWYSITTDQTTSPVDDSNPIQSVKDRSVVVFSGAGGRSSQTMTGKHRRYHPSGVGIISSDTVDSGDVATITYLTANPQFTSVYGTTGKLDDPDANAAACFSESMLMLPGAKYDD